MFFEHFNFFKAAWNKILCFLILYCLTKMVLQEHKRRLFLHTKTHLKVSLSFVAFLISLS